MQLAQLWYCCCCHGFPVMVDTMSYTGYTQEIQICPQETSLTSATGDSQEIHRRREHNENQFNILCVMISCKLHMQMLDQLAGNMTTDIQCGKHLTNGGISGLKTCERTEGQKSPCTTTFCWQHRAWAKLISATNTHKQTNRMKSLCHVLAT